MSRDDPGRGSRRHVSNDDRLARWTRYWRRERNSATLFEGLAEVERTRRNRELFQHLAALERDHALRWEERLHAAGAPPPPFAPSRRTRGLLWLARRVDPALILPRVAALETRDAERYLGLPIEPGLVRDEAANAARLRHLGQNEASEFAKKLLLVLRRPVHLVVAATLFAVSLLLGRNAQIEGLVFGLLAGVLVGPVMHYLLGKLLIPLGAGRVWCGWACWTAAVLDRLPFDSSPGRLPGRWGGLRWLHLGLSVALVATLVVGLGVPAASGANGPRAALGFLAGNLVYWAVGIALAYRFRDNRAFCKLLCPVAPILKLTSRPALVKIAGDASACRSCASKACLRVCPMDVRIPDYVEAGQRVLSSECIFCQRCVAVCPPNTLAPTIGFDLGGRDRLEIRPRGRAEGDPE